MNTRDNAPYQGQPPYQAQHQPYSGQPQTYQGQPQSYQDHGQPGDPGYPPVRPNLRNLTKDEMLALKECRTESFWFRSVPLVAGGTSVFWYAQRQKLFTPKVHPGWIYAAITIGGYVLGKLSYMGECRAKLLRLQNSPLADALRRQDVGRGVEVLQEFSQFPGVDSMSQFKTPDFHGYQQPDNYSNPDFLTGQGGGPDHSAEQAESQQRKTTSYEELRARNRAPYTQPSQRRLEPPVQQKPPADFGSTSWNEFDDKRGVQRQAHEFDDRRGAQQRQTQEFDDKSGFSDSKQKFGSEFDDRRSSFKSSW